MTEPNHKPITTRDLQRIFLETVYKVTKDHKLVTACHFIYDDNLAGK